MLQAAAQIPTGTFSNQLERFRLRTKATVVKVEGMLAS